MTMEHFKRDGKRATCMSSGDTTAIAVSLFLTGDSFECLEGGDDEAVEMAEAPPGNSFVSMSLSASYLKWTCIYSTSLVREGIFKSG